MRRHPGLYLTLIIIVAVAAALFVYPKNWGAQTMPWRLGLDLVGGTHLVYQIDLSQVAASDRDSVVQGLRDVIEKRVNLFGVSEPQVYIAETGNSAQLDVDLAGVKNVTDAINQIGETPLLDFAEVEQNGIIHAVRADEPDGTVHHGRATHVQPDDRQAAGADRIQ